MQANLKSKSRAVVRRAEETDLSSIMRIEESSFKSEDTFPMALFRRYLKELRDGFYVVLDGENTVAGYTVFEDVGEECYVLSIAVFPESRNQGLATSLMLFMENECRKRGLSKIVLDVRVDNEGAISFYRRLGLAEAGRKARFYEDGADALMMEKHLVASAKQGCLRVN